VEAIIRLERLDAVKEALAGRSVPLTYREYELLSFLLSNPDNVFTRDALLSRV
jgi:DNA-binding response OmpR family regulator